MAKSSMLTSAGDGYIITHAVILFTYNISSGRSNKGIFISNDRGLYDFKLTVT